MKSIKLSNFRSFMYSAWIYIKLVLASLILLFSLVKLFSLIVGYSFITLNQVLKSHFLGTSTIYLTFILVSVIALITTMHQFKIFKK